MPVRKAPMIPAAKITSPYQPWVSAAAYLAIAVFYALPVAQWRARLARR